MARSFTAFPIALTGFVTVDYATRIRSEIALWVKSYDPPQDGECPIDVVALLAEEVPCFVEDVTVSIAVRQPLGDSRVLMSCRREVSKLLIGFFLAKSLTYVMRLLFELREHYVQQPPPFSRGAW